MLKRTALVLVIAGSVVGSPVESWAQNPLRWYFKRTVKDSIVRTPPDSSRSQSQVVTFDRLSENSYKVTTVTRNLGIWAGPSLGFDVFSRESGTGKHVTGVIPGIGYGIKWGRLSEDPNKEATAFLAVDLFVSGAESDDDPDHEGNDYFNIDVQPVVTLLNWVSVGYGPRFKTGLDGHDSKTRWVFTFGIKKAP